MSTIGKTDLLDNEQRNYTKQELHEQKAANRYNEGQDNAHLYNDSKDSRSLLDRAKAEEMYGHEDDGPKTKEGELSQINPTLPAKNHGNEPSRGAKIDEEIKNEEEEELKRKGKA
ncbi:hypothetical protein SISNIDRAFT_345860 [Sistotremastrum niveocremeum HHB9708]|uniref:Uncharacterized protein n=2 Tax=Sistotremastraceae TaxID=3402574 RepID=A0A164WU14_9AGAM|nr:hypothetical protein SISNIDRAFT_345860 [Sistotremastrum niveocremeum HHB9708]KZT37171.1 hypothetical protein SISSUDRAFT_1063047 [Sistotremastrum suecicum HHB10207 ss-3]